MTPNAAAGYTERVTRALTAERDHPRLGRVAVIRFAPPQGEERRPATLGPASIEAVTGAIAEVLDRAEAGEIDAIALTGTGRVFLAGADLAMFADPEAVRGVGRMTAAAHALQARVRAAGVPILAHLNGAALGGGLEVALMAGVRTAAPGARGIGLPETSLGILPGWGGTTLLPTVLDPEAAVRIILEDPSRDRTLSAGQALDLGLVDALAEDLDGALDALADAVIAGDADGSAPATDGTGLAAGTGPAADGSGPADEAAQALLAGDLPGPDSAWAQALRAALDAPHSPAESRRQWARRLAAQGAPAVATALDLLDQLPGSKLEDALEREAGALAGLVMSPSASASLYAAELLRRGKPGRAPVAGAREIGRVGLAGAGLMAAQIAAQFAIGLQVPVLLRDLDEATAEKGLQAARAVVGRTAERGRLSPEDAERIAGLLSATADVADLAGCDLVLEAVPEVLAVKRAVLAELEGVLAPEALLVSNTSSLSIAAMAEGLEHPERVIGLHFFNPVEKMPLVEVIAAEGADPAALATGREVVRRLGKFAVDSADAPGFIVNRLLFRVLGEVLAALDAGADPAAVDASLDELGLPMRPLALLDLVGLGVADHVGVVLREQLGDRFHASPLLHAMAESGARFTEPARDAVHAPVSASVRELISAHGNGSDGAGHPGAVQPAADHPGAEQAPVGAALLEAVLAALAEEIGIMLEEGVAARPEDIDLALVLGAGFPRHRGGVTPYLDSSGASERVRGSAFHGPRFRAGEAADS